MAVVLLERERVLAELEDRLARARAGDGGALVVMGVAGAGKTALVEAARASAADAGMAVLTATGSELEQDHAFGVVRQALGREPVVAPAATTGSGPSGAVLAGDGAPPGAEPFAVLDALYWALAGVTERCPAALVVDDAHWCDEPSARWLSFVRTRLAGLPLALVVTARPSALDRPSLAPLLTGADVVDLPPLSAAAATALLRDRSGVDVAEQLAHRCHAAAEGNPFYLAVLARGLAEAGADAVERALDGAPLPDVVRRGVVARVRSLGPAALAVARGVAVLGPNATVPLVARLAGLTPELAGATVQALAGAGVLRPTDVVVFEHPLVRAAVAEDLAGHERATAHRAAARLLAGAGAPAGQVAAHLLATEPGDEVWVVETLVAGARQALRSGAPDTAATLLRRALREPLARRSPELLLELGQAAVLARQPDALDHLAQAVELARDDGLLAAAARALGKALGYAGRTEEAVQVLEAARSRLGPDEEVRRVEVDLDLSAVGALDIRTLARSDAALERCRPTGDRRVDLLLLAHRSVQPARRGTCAREAVELAEASLADGPLVGGHGPDDMAGFFPAIALMLGDELDSARRRLTEAWEQARAAGSVVGMCTALLWRSHAALRAGAVHEAAADVLDASRLVAVAELPLFLPYATSFLSDVHLERGELDDAEWAWSALGLDTEMPLILPANYVLFSRGCLHAARGRLREAARDLLESGRRQALWDARGPGFWPWASQAALTLAQLGEADRARELVEQELEAARAFGARRPVGIALRARGLLEQGTARVDLLEAAREALTGSPAALERLRTDVDLGAALLRVGRSVDGIAVLEEARRTAERCGAGALARQARAELVAAGARTRGGGPHGVGALTISERRVVDLAVQGLTNREIARSLFVTPKTVETHLARAFRKLDVASRRELVRVPGLTPTPASQGGVPDAPVSDNS